MPVGQRDENDSLGGGTKKKEGRERGRRESEDESRGLRHALREGQKWAKASANN